MNKILFWFRKLMAFGNPLELEDLNKEQGFWESLGWRKTKFFSVMYAFLIGIILIIIQFKFIPFSKVSSSLELSPYGVVLLFPLFIGIGMMLIGIILLIDKQKEKNK